MLKFLKSKDIYGHNVGVLYKSNTHHNTLFGSFLSLVTFLVILSFAILKFIELF